MKLAATKLHVTKALLFMKLAATKLHVTKALLFMKLAVTKLHVTKALLFMKRRVLQVGCQLQITNAELSDKPNQQQVGLEVGKFYIVDLSGSILHLQPDNQLAKLSVTLSDKPSQQQST